jgi:hypothetical protein
LEQGASTTLYAALAPELKGKTFGLSSLDSINVHSEHSGAFLENCTNSTATLLEHAKGAEKQEMLWALSEKLVGEKF